MNNLSDPILFLIIGVLFFAVQIVIIRWVLRINDIVFYLDKINEKLYKITEEKKLNNNNS
ncbi:UNVERIFIED_ORG: hypothetical protein DFS12_107222 [Chitinophaga ginsengisegetis]|nr:hypothetical protein [Chitinophaga ginsengisegetis]MDR6649794.1 hypothetical protein [Chitinophaga ginsengisegetis]MDR6656003.1 hypothetical protein [Chitinophaga ginsengisegetis]